jgi:purine-nucleoside phosphorylase
MHRDLKGVTAEIGLVLGSGLSAVAEKLQNRIAIPYSELPGFPADAGVSGHGRELVIGHHGKRRVAILTGRVHTYEGGDAAAMRAPIAMLKAMGCDRLLLTNAAGSLRADMPPGSLMAISDHINWAGKSPLIGDHADERFVDMSQAYDPGLRAALKRAAAKTGSTLHEGIYMWWIGPMFETPAEIRAARILGADAIGMSTAPEVILARRMGLRVAAISSITNLAAGMGPPLSHAHTKAVAATVIGALTALVHAFLEEDHA